MVSVWRVCVCMYVCGVSLCVCCVCVYGSYVCVMCMCVYMCVHVSMCDLHVHMLLLFFLFCFVLFLVFFSSLIFIGLFVF